MATTTMASETTVLTYRQLSPKTVVEAKHTGHISESTKDHKLLVWNELDEWQKTESKVIESGYREATPSLWGCIRSWFYLHNESVNIFSHLFGAVLFASLAVALYREMNYRYDNWTTGDVAAFSIFILGVIICFSFSALFHTCASHSYEGYYIARQLDFLGIIVLVLSTSAPQVYYTFYSEPNVQRNYWSLISLFGSLAAIVTFNPSFSKPSRNSSRVAVFAGLGFSTFAPVMHGLFRHGWDAQSNRFPLWAVALTHAFNIFGAIVYVLHFPERWWPRVFDIFGASHQLMHCSIIGAALTLLVGSIVAFENVHAE